MASKVSDSDKGSFDRFISCCEQVKNTASRNEKTQIIKDWLSSDFDGDKLIFLELILPKQTGRTYQMNNKKMTKLFASIFKQNVSFIDDKLTKGKNAGYIARVMAECYASSNCTFPLRNKASIISMLEVNNALKQLSKETKMKQQEDLLKSVVLKCTQKDLEYFILCIDRDLKIDAGTKTVLDGIDEKAYSTWKMNSNLSYIVNKLSMGKRLSTCGGVEPGSPFKPMLAAAIGDYKKALTKCTSGVIYAEIKYDGERVQVHFDGKEWKFYSRSLKAVQPYKIEHVKDSLPKSCKNARNLIIDSEILMINTKTGKYEPFQSLSKWKKNKQSKEFKDCRPVLVLFDILYFNDRSLMDVTLDDRRKILEQNFKQIENEIHLSELHTITTEDDLEDLFMQMMQSKEEGLMLKDSKGLYVPNKRHWYKMKRDYLDNGSMADSADLIVLACYRGKGKHGGKYSIFLMGTFDEDNNDFKTVCKVHSGLTDEDIDHFTETLKFDVFDPNACPSWLKVTRTMEPWLVIKNPKKSVVFEVVGYEFTESKAHTATDENGKGCSLRFPRIQRIREDKGWKDATNLKELRYLVKESRENPADKMKKNKKKRKKKDDDNNDDGSNDVSPPKKRKLNNGNVQAQAQKNKKNHNRKRSPSPTPPIVDDMDEDDSDEDDRKTCQYDDSCYRKNPVHFGEYKHPKKENAENEKIKARNAKRIDEIEEKKAKKMKAASIMKEKELKKAKDAYDKLEKAAEAKYQEIVDKAQSEFDDSMVKIKEDEQNDLKMITKKYHPK